MGEADLSWRWQGFTQHRGLQKQQSQSTPQLQPTKVQLPIFRFCAFAHLSLLLRIPALSSICSNLALLSATQSHFFDHSSLRCFFLTWSSTENIAYTIHSSLLFTHSFVHNFSKLWCTWYPELPWWLRWQRICPQFRRRRLDPGSGKSPGKGNHNPLQYSWDSGESHGQRRLADYSPWGCRVGHNWVTNTHTSGTIQSAASFDNYSFVVILFLQAKCNILL